MGLFRSLYKKGAEKAKAKYGVDVPDYDVVKSTVNGTGAVEETSAKASKPPNTGVPPTRWEKVSVGQQYDQALIIMARCDCARIAVHCGR